MRSPNASLRVGALAVGILCACLAQAHVISPKGVWRVVDDKTSQAHFIVRVFAENDEVKGTVEKILAPVSEMRCEKCAGQNRDQPVQGMLVLWGFRYKDGDYKGGQFLDPEDGKLYRGSLRVAEDGKRLMVRGYPGLSFSARSWTLLREGEQPMEVLAPDGTGKESSQ
jgi:uncharacterized protein (DUF2147 family)